MVICLCFTKKVLSDLSKLDLYKEMLSKSVEFAKKFYQVILYTDSETLPDLETIQVEKRLVDSSDFYFIDDFKVHLLDKVLCENSTLIDVDLFLFKPLNFQEGFDLYADYKEKSTEEWYTQYIDILLENGVKEILPNFGSKTYFPPNIGIIKFTNVEYKREYIDTYTLLKNWIVNKGLKLDRGASMVLGQYTLALLNVDNKYRIYYCRNQNTNNNFLHLSGPIKFEKDALKKYLPTSTYKLI